MNNAPADKVELGELADSMGFLLRLAQVKVFDTFYENMHGTGLKPGEFSVLWVIALNKDVPQGAIASRLSIKPAHMTRLIQRMVQAGLVQRNTPENDRRSIRLSLTKQGQKLVTQNKADFIRFHQTERAGLSNTELAQMIKLLKKFTSLD